ncbi:MAG TPA: SUF system Fe-S cluster assembly protein [Candidatus Onthomorpha intestinigallinarum]|uniref:SUF system Fe-S cluster assembly protein n=1 Tax=Candidatus Onthomorpha intestinigallinarum TaxID=2840880 RepID=A0A9D1RGN2_9BACT|nr:SUF system Fe-S cluster assembly protein [Candidatus Onthomorpha intestinigallinarum]
MDLNKEMLKYRIIQVLKTIYDPEIPVNIYELGLVYDIDINDDNDVLVLMTLTAPNCPVAESLPLEVEEAVKHTEGVNNVQIQLTFEPAWTMDRLSDEAKLELGLL